MLPTPPPARSLLAMLLVLTAMAAETEAPPAATDTRLAAGDLLRIEVFDNPDLAISVRVPASGTITYPLIGEVRDLLSRPLTEVAAEIRRRLEADYLRRAEINAVVLETARQQQVQQAAAVAGRVYVSGRVRNSGALPMPPGERLTVSKAIILAGGFDDFARQDAVQLHHGEQVSTIDVKAVLAGKGGADPEVQAGDTITVPESRF